MFTGLIENQGTVWEVRQEGAAVRLAIEVPDEMAADCRVGDSVAINGCCLTVVEIDGRNWVFQAGAETLSKTNLGRLAPGHAVNLERALPTHGRIGGHFVQGHVDGTGEVATIERNDEWVTMWFRVSEQTTATMVPKGSVAVDGVSLTLVNVERDRFSVALIPHTLGVTTLGTRGTGDTVNIETDILGKYVQKLMGRSSAVDAPRTMHG